MAVISRKQHKFATGATASATFDQAPVQGNLLVVISFHRQDGTTPTISGTGWTRRILRTTQIGNTFARRGIALWSKVAGAGEPSNIQVSWAPAVASNHRILILEFAADATVTWAHAASASNDNGTTVGGTSLSTGTTASVTAGDLLVVGLVGLRNGEGSDISQVAFSGNASGSVLVSNGGSNGGSIGAAGWQEAQAGPRSSTVTWAFSGGSDSTGESAGISVFRATTVTASTPPPAQQLTPNRIVSQHISNTQAALFDHGLGINAHASSLQEHTNLLLEHSTSILGNNSRLDLLEPRVDQAEVDIASNAANILTNSNNIAANAVGIINNANAIAANAGNIATLNSNIASVQAQTLVNAGNISTNASAISSNNSLIAANASAINANTSNISLIFSLFPITGANIAFGAISNPHIQNGAVTNGKILDGEVIGSKIGLGAVSETKIQNNAVTSPKIANGAVQEHNLGTSAVTGPKIAPDAVGAGKIDRLSSALRFTSGSRDWHQFVSGTSLVFRDQTGAQTMIEIRAGSGILAPILDDQQDLGRLAARWRDIYAGNGVIQTSDADDKQEIRDTPLGLEFIQRLQARSWEWKNPKARSGRHHGLVAQEVRTALQGADFAGLVEDDGRLGFNYSEMVGPLVRAVQELAARVEQLEAERIL